MSRLAAACRRVPALATLLLALSACGDESVAPEVIDRDTFVQVYVDLRRASAEAGSAAAFEAARDSVLERHGVTTEQLMTFIDVRGRDIDGMVEVWDEIEERLTREAVDSAEG